MQCVAGDSSLSISEAAIAQEGWLCMSLTMGIVLRTVFIVLTTQSYIGSFVFSCLGWSCGMSVKKATPTENVAVEKVVNMVKVGVCKCIRCINPLMQPLAHDGDHEPVAVEDEADADPADLDDPVPMQISKMKYQIAALEASGDAVLSCLMGSCLQIYVCVIEVNKLHPPLKI